LQNSFKINAPTFIYKILYGKYPSPPLFGRGAAHREKIIDGVGIDYNIPTSIIKKLNNINGIELRSSCEGTDELRPTFLIFRPLTQDEKYVKKIVKNLNKFEDISAGYDIGLGGKYRIGVTTKLWFSKENKKRFIQWWVSLPIKISKSLD